MQQITDPRNLDKTQIAYRMEGLKPSHLRILSYLVQGMNYSEIEELLSMKNGIASNQIQNACDRVGVSTRSQLIAMFTLWSCSQPKEMMTKHESLHQHTEYPFAKLINRARVVTKTVTQGLKLWMHKP